MAGNLDVFLNERRVGQLQQDDTPSSNKVSPIVLANCARVVSLG
jgi:hypothetical protein